MHIKKGDKVKVLSGKDKGKEGEVILALPKKNKVVVGGVNLVKRHQKPNQAHPQGGIIDKEMPLLACKVMLICPECNKATRVGHQFIGEKKSRVCKKCGKQID